MDGLRGYFGRDAEYAPEYEPVEDDVVEAPPSPVGQDERRMQVRAYNHWAGLLGSGAFPSIEDLDPDVLTDFGPYSVLLDFSGGIDDPAIQWLGTELAIECGAAGDIKRLCDVPGRTLLTRITDHYLQILGNQAPIGFEAEFVNQRSATILYRGILLPYSSDEQTIDFVYGVINWKEVADQATSDELLLEIDQALAAGERPARPRPALADWADGPIGADDDGDDVPADVSADAPFDTPVDGEPAERPAEYPATLAGQLAAARACATAAQTGEDRTRTALYTAIGRAHDFALAAAAAPAECAALLADAGLTAQARAPKTPIVKLVFGADYDKTRLTEYAAALAHADRLGLEAGALPGFLEGFDGGLKGVVKAERALRREARGGSGPADRSAALADRLRALPAQGWHTIERPGEEFALVLVRRDDNGETAILGEVPNDPALIERAARKLMG